MSAPSPIAPKTYRLLTYRGHDGPRAGLLMADTIYDAEAAAGRADYRTVLGILDDWSAADARFAAWASEGRAPGVGLPLATTELLAPVQYPGQIWAAGANFADHISEMPEFSVINAKTVAGGRAWHFSKTSRGAVVGPNTQQALPYYSQKVDWEIELAVVIGRQASRLSAAEAMSCVAGYTIANDLSARDFVARPGIAPDSPFRFDWLSHKGFEGACPMGPWITPARYIDNPHQLDMKLWIDGELMQDSNTRHMIFDIGEQIEEISARLPLYPGDVIMTGTPSGVGFGRGVFLKSGQQLRLWIQDLGELRHGFL